MATTEVATTKRREMTTSGVIKDWLSRPEAQQRIGAALMGQIDGAAFAQQCIIVARDPKFANCSAESLLTGLLTCAQVGLAPGAHGLVDLIPRKNEVQVQVSWRGFKVLMERVPGIRQVKPILVHVKDEFRYENGQIVHSFDPFAPDRIVNGPEDIRGGYLWIGYDDDRVDYHFVPVSKIEANRRCAQTQEIWKKWYEPMALKTIIRDAWARRAVPFDPIAASHLDAAEKHDRSVLGEDPARIEEKKEEPKDDIIARAITYDETTGVVDEHVNTTAEPSETKA